MNKRTWAVIDLDALTDNFILAQRSSGVRVMPVIKADAYGHGACACAQALAEVGADIFAVSCVDEAIELRRAGIQTDLLILGYTSPDSFDQLIDENLTQTVMSVDYAKTLSKAAQARGVRVKTHIKLDTGMARLGLCVRHEQDVAVCASDIVAICRLQGLDVEGIFTHFAVSDVPDQAFTSNQCELFARTVALAREQGADIPIKHCANSGAILNHPDQHWDMVREGIMLYGEKPDPSCPDPGLKPVLTLKSVVAFRSVLHKGETVSYGRTFTAQQDMPIAVIPIGYADGYPRSLSNQGWVSIDGHRCPIVGRVCMDQMMVDVSACPQVQPGQEVTVIGGQGPSLTQLAALCNTINYELMCAISVRVPRVYISNGKTVEVRSRIVE